MLFTNNALCSDSLNNAKGGNKSLNSCHMRGVCSKTNDDYDRPQVSLMDIQNLLNWVEVTEKSIYVAVFSHTCFFATLMRLR